MNPGEVYASKEADWAPQAATVVVTIESGSQQDHEMIECLVVVDDASLSMYGSGTTDHWQIKQLRDHFVRIV